jgi:hypothetical protein
MATVGSYVFVQCCYLVDQHALTRESASGVAPVFVVALALGVSQIALDSGLLGRTAWLVIAVGVLGMAARWSRSVDAGILGALFAGPFRRVGDWIRVVTVPS